MPNQVFVITLLLLILKQSFTQADEDTEARCNVERYVSYINESEIICTNIGIDGQPLDAVLRQVNYFDRSQGNLTFGDLQHTITQIHVAWTSGNVTINENGLASMPKLKRLLIASKMQKYGFDVSPTEFKNAPHLSKLYLENFILTNNALRAIESLKDQLEILSIPYCTPEREMLASVEKLAKLSTLDITAVKEIEIPTALFKGSAETLTHVAITFSQLPTIASTMFRGMKKLAILSLPSNNITTIEPGAFDDLTNLIKLSLKDNNIKTVPQGLFDKMKKLKWVDLSMNGLEGVTRENFTHCPELKHVSL